MTGPPEPPPDQLELLPVPGLPEVRPGDDLAGLLAAHASWARDGDVLVVTSKVVSKAEGRLVRDLSRAAAVTGETARLVASRGPLRVTRTHHGLVLAAAGVDASNLPPGTLALLPRDPDASARRLRTDLTRLLGRNVAVVVTDTAGRAWRLGQTDIAIGCAGLQPLDDHAGRYDRYGNRLDVTAPAVADELAGAAELVTGKLTGRPAAVVRGLRHRVLAPGEDGPGARALVRDPADDLFCLGSREAVRDAVRLAGTAAPGVPPPDLRPVLAAVGAVAAPAGVAVEVLVEADSVAVVVRATTPVEGAAPLQVGVLVGHLQVGLAGEGLAGVWRHLPEAPFGRLDVTVPAGPPP